MTDLDAKVQQMSQQMERLQHTQGQYNTPPPSSIPPAAMSFGNHFPNGIENGSDPPRTLPPLVNAAAMQGVQYSEGR